MYATYSPIRGFQKEQFQPKPVYARVCLCRELTMATIKGAYVSMKFLAQGLSAKAADNTMKRLKDAKQ